MKLKLRLLEKFALGVSLLFASLLWFVVLVHIFKVGSILDLGVPSLIFVASIVLLPAFEILRSGRIARYGLTFRSALVFLVGNFAGAFGTFGSIYWELVTVIGSCLFVFAGGGIFRVLKGFLRKRNRS